MKNLLLLSFFITITYPIFAQIEGKVINAETGQPIVYTNIWVQNQNIGTTTNKNGIYKFDALSDTVSLVFSALGFETQTIKITDLPKVIKLKPIALELTTVTVSPPKFRKKKRTGALNKKGIRLWFVSFEQPWRIGKIFTNKTEYEKTPFLKELEIVVSAHVKNRKILIHILEVGKGTPDTWTILEENIEHTIKTKPHKPTITTVDLKPYQIKMPKKGVMILVEWLIIDSNRYDFTYTDRITGEEKAAFWHEPKVGTIPSETDENTWRYSKGEWTRDHRKSEKAPKGYENKFVELAMELILSD